MTTTQPPQGSQDPSSMDLEMNKPPRSINDQGTVDTAEKSSLTSHTFQPDGDNGDDVHDSDDVHDPNVVWWDGDKDPENPRNWTMKQKYINGFLISMCTFVTPLASSIFAPGVPELMVDFRESSTQLASFVVSVYVLGFAIGPMLMAPLSEVYGRVPIYHICNVFFVAFTIGCAKAPSMGALIAFRFFAGCFGSAPMTNGGGSIADMFIPEQRAAVMGAFSLGPLLGPIIGPVIGGVLSDTKGWRWSFWIIVIVGGFLLVCMLLFLRETFAPVILERKAARLRKETGNMQLRSKLDAGLSTQELFKRAIVRPLKLLVRSPICVIFAVYLMLAYGYLYLLFTSITFVFQKTYGFNAETSGLVYLGLGIGCLAGILIFALDSGRALKKATSEGAAKPEVHLKLLPFGAAVFPIGFFIYGWTAHYETHWIAPIIGLCVIGVGNLLMFMAVSVYLVDAFETYAASALAANTIMRSIAGAVLPLCGLQMYDSLGIGWGNTLLGLVAVTLLPGAILVLRYGETLRVKFAIKDL